MKFETREDKATGELYIEGHFAVFGAKYELWEGATESVEAGAFAETLDEDIRALIDHETRLVLGRNKAKTLELREDEHGLWGCIRVNQKDVDAMNLYTRIQRGDVDQCSFGFDIIKEKEVMNGTKIHWTIQKVKLYEVSVVTFPAYEDTGVTARKQEYDQIIKRKTDAWRQTARARLKTGGQ